MSNQNLEISRTFQKFSSLSLDEAFGIAFANRIDTKFVITKIQLNQLIADLSKDCKVLTINNLRLSNYQSDYYDTADLKLFREHINRRKNRYKFRFRNYKDSDLKFFEIKFKDNKNYTTKYRIECDKRLDYIDQNLMHFIQEHTPYNGEILQSSISVAYTRATIYDPSLSERITLDLNLELWNTSDKESYNDLVILELKQSTIDRNSYLYKKIKGLRIRPYRISKYCLGIVSCNPDAKQNTYKQKIRYLQKLSKHG